MNRLTKRLLFAVLTIPVFACIGGFCAGQDDTAQEPDVNSLINQLSSNYCCQREYALRELIERSEAAMPSMMTVLQSNDYHSRAAAVRFFEAAAAPRIAPRLLVILEKSRNIEIVTGLTRLLARLKHGKAVGHIRGLLLNDSSKVRAAAVDALTELGDKESAKKISVLVGDDYSEVRIAAAKALAAFHAVDFGGKVLTQFKVERIPEVQRALVECLGALRVKEAVPLLVEAIKREDSPVFPQSVKALSETGGDEARDALIDLLMRSDDMEMLDISSTAVGRIGEDAIPVLKEKLKGLEQDSDGRWKIISAYGEMGGYVIPHFAELLEDETYPFFKDRISLKMIEVVKREFGESLPPGDYRLIYDEPFEEWQRKIENWKKWVEENKND